MVDTATITGAIFNPDGTIPTNALARFTMSGFDTDAPESATIIPAPVDMEIDAAGEIDGILWPSPDGVRSTFYRVDVVVRNAGVADTVYNLSTIEVPAASGTYDISSLLSVQAPAGVSVDQYLAALQASVVTAQNAAADAAESAAQAIGGLVLKETWVALSAITATQNGIGGGVIDDDTGTHSDATATGYNGATVQNAGRYSYNAAWDRWERIGDNLDFAGVQDDIAALQAQNAVVLLENGAVGDGVANDKAVIDTYNVAGTLVDLGGRDYFYVGDFAPAASYVNGRIFTSVGNPFDYTTLRILNDKTVTVGPSQDFTDLGAAWDWLLSGIRVFGTLTLSGTGVHDMAGRSFPHPDAARIRIIGQTLNGTQPDIDDMTGDRVADEAFIRARVPFQIEVGGTGDNTSGIMAWKFPNGIGDLDKIAIFGNTRYPTDFGYNGSHSQSGTAGKVRIGDVTFFGGVWPFIAVNPEMRTSVGKLVFCAYQDTGTQPAGGPNIISGHWDNEGSLHTYNNGDTPAKYVVYGERNTNIKIRSGGLRGKGRFLHGIFAAPTADILANSPNFDGVTQPITVQPMATVECNTPTCANGDDTITGALVAAQGGFGNNFASGAMIHISGGGTLIGNAGTFTNMIARYGMHCIGGTIKWGVSDTVFDDCQFKVAAARVYNASTGFFRPKVTNPKAGSLDQCLALALSQMRTNSTGSGCSFAPAVNTPTNGNLWSTTG